MWIETTALPSASWISQADFDVLLQLLGRNLSREAMLAAAVMKQKAVGSGTVAGQRIVNIRS